MEQELKEERGGMPVAGIDERPRMPVACVLGIIAVIALLITQLTFFAQLRYLAGHAMDLQAEISEIRKEQLQIQQDIADLQSDLYWNLQDLQRTDKRIDALYQYIFTNSQLKMGVN